MRWIAAVVIWTAFVAMVIYLTPGLVGAFGDMPGCGTVGLSATDRAACDAIWAAQGDVIWRAQTLPILVLSVGGYVLIALLALDRRRA